MVKKILFVNGPSQDPSDRFFGWPTSLLYAIAPTVQAIKDGELRLDYVPKIFDPIWYVEQNNSEKIKSEFKKILEKENVGVVCASTTYDSLYPTLQLFSEAKKINPEIKTIIGGPHVDEVHELQNNEITQNQVVDFAIAGEGDYSLKAVLEAISNNSLSDLNPRNISGRSWIYYKGEKYSTKGIPLNLNELPFIPIELVDTERHKHNFDIFHNIEKILPTIQMIAQRGCIYNCNFCSERKDLAYSTSRSIDSVMEEIELRKEQGFEAVFFDDSTFGAFKNKQRGIKDLLKELEKTKMVFGSLNRFNHLNNPEIVEHYRRAGFEYLYCSIEQFDDYTLKSMNKHQKVEEIESSMKLLSQNGFKVGVSLLYGFPYETKESIKKTMDFTKKWVDEGTIILVSESILSYHPGTPIIKNKKLRFNRSLPNKGPPFSKFEEGQWYHPKHVNLEYLEKILQTSEEKFKKVMVRNRHSWYAEQGFLLNN